MPKAAIDEHCDTLRRKGKIWTSRQGKMSTPTMYSVLAKNFG
jgi:hypothetical protein